MDLNVGDVATNLVADLASAAIVSSTSAVRRRLTRHKPLAAAVREALAGSLMEVSPHIDRDAAVRQGARWQSTLPKGELAPLVRPLADPTRAAEFLDLPSLEPVLAEVASAGGDPQEFARAFHEKLYDSLVSRAPTDPELAPVVILLNAQRQESRQRRAEATATAAQYRDDLRHLVSDLRLSAESNLPQYLLDFSYRRSQESTANDPSPRPAGILDVTQPARMRPYDATRGASDPISVLFGQSEASRAWTDVMAEHRRILVRAPAGYGKSWLLRTEVHRLATRVLDSLDAGENVGAEPFPVWLRWDQLPSGGGADLGEAIAAGLVEGHLLPPRSQQRLRESIDEGKAILLLDALDEVPYARARELVASLELWSARHPGSRLVLTGREREGLRERIPGLYEVELEPFSRAAQEGLVNAWPMAETARARVLRWADSPSGRGLARVPLVLALVCRRAATTGSAIPDSRTLLLHEVLHGFLEVSGGADSAVVERMLDDLATVVTQEATESDGSLENLSVRSFTLALDGKRADELVPSLLRSGLLVPALTVQRHQYQLPHRVFHEYLIARYVSGVTGGWSDVVEEHLFFDRDWGDVIPLLGGTLARPDELVRRLLRQSPDPFHGALLMSARVVAEIPELLPDRYGELGAELVSRLLVLTDSRAQAARAWAALAAVAARLPARVQSLLVDGIRARGIPEGAVDALSALMDTPSAVALVEDRLARRVTDDLPDTYTEALVDCLAAGTGRTVTDALLDLLDSDGVTSRYAAEALAHRLDRYTCQRLCALAQDLTTSTEQRIEALELLAAHQGAEAVTASTRLLSDPDAEIREAAAASLGTRHSVPPPAVTALIDLIDDPDPQVATAAARALSDVPGLEATSALTRLLLTSPYPADRVHGGLPELMPGVTGPGLREIWESRPSGEIVASVRDLVLGPSAQAPDAAVDLLAGLGSPDALEALLDLLSPERSPQASSNVRAAVLDVLVAWRDLSPEQPTAAALLTGRTTPEAPPSPLGARHPEVTSAVRQVLAHDPDAKLRELAAVCLLHVAPLQDLDRRWRRRLLRARAWHQMVLPDLVRSPEDDLRRLARRLVARSRSVPVHLEAQRLGIGSRRTLRLLLRALREGSPGPDHGGDVLGVLSADPSPRVTEALTALLTDTSDDMLRARTLRALARRGPLSDDLLMQMARSGVETRAAALRVLELSHGGQAVTILRQLLAGHEDPMVRVTALNLLRDGLGVNAAPDLLVALQDPTRAVRSAAASQLRSLGEDRPVDRLLALLTSPPGTPAPASVAAPDDQVSESALEALRGSCDERVAAAQVSALTHGSPRLRELAAAQLAGQAHIQAASALIAAAADPVAAVRLAVVRALGVRPGRTVARALADALRDEDPAVRVAAVDGLRFRIPRAAVVTLKRLARSGNPTEATAARRALRTQASWRQACRAASRRVDTLDGRGSGVVTATLDPAAADLGGLATMWRLWDRHPTVRARAVQVLAARLDAEGVVSGLCAVLRDPDPRVRAAAAGALRHAESEQVTRQLLEALGVEQVEVALRGICGAVEQRLGRDVTGDLVERLASLRAGRHAPLRVCLIGAIGRRADRHPETGLLSIPDCLLGPAWGNRRWTRRPADDEASHARMLQTLEHHLDDPNPAVRAAAVHALARRSDHLQSRLAERLDDESAQVRTALVQALRRKSLQLLGEPGPEPPEQVAEFLRSPRREVRAAAAQILATTAGWQFLGPLREVQRERWESPEVPRQVALLAGHPDPDVYEPVVQLLQWRRNGLPETDAVDRLHGAFMRLLRHPERAVREASALWLRTEPSEKVATALLEVLATCRAEHRPTVATTLRGRHDAPVVQALIDLLTVDDPATRAAAADALRPIRSEFLTATLTAAWAGSAGDPSSVVAELLLDHIDRARLATFDWSGAWSGASEVEVPPDRGIGFDTEVAIMHERLHHLAALSGKRAPELVTQVWAETGAWATALVEHLAECATDLPVGIRRNLATLDEETLAALLRECERAATAYLSRRPECRQRLVETLDQVSRTVFTTPRRSSR